MAAIEKKTSVSTGGSSATRSDVLGHCCQSCSSQAGHTRRGGAMMTFPRTAGTGVTQHQQHMRCSRETGWHGSRRGHCVLRSPLAVCNLLTQQVIWLPLVVRHRHHSRGRMRSMIVRILAAIIIDLSIIWPKIHCCSVYSTLYRVGRVPRQIRRSVERGCRGPWPVARPILRFSRFNNRRAAAQPLESVR